MNNITVKEASFIIKASQVGRTCPWIECVCHMCWIGAGPGKFKYGITGTIAGLRLPHVLHVISYSEATGDLPDARIVKVGITKTQL